MTVLLRPGVPRDKAFCRPFRGVSRNAMCNTERNGKTNNTITIAADAERLHIFVLYGVGLHGKNTILFPFRRVKKDHSASNSTVWLYLSRASCRAVMALLTRS